LKSVSISTRQGEIRTSQVFENVLDIKNEPPTVYGTPASYERGTPVQEEGFAHAEISGFQESLYRGTSLIRNNTSLGPYMCSRLTPRALWWSLGEALFLISEVPMYMCM
jgi:hypothetical protein